MKRIATNPESQTQSEVPMTPVQKSTSEVVLPEQPPTPSHTRVMHGPIPPETPTNAPSAMAVDETPTATGFGEKRKEPEAGFGSRMSSRSAKRQKISLASSPIDLAEE